MRKLIVLGLLASLVGCQSIQGPFGNRKRDKELGSKDPLLSPDLDEQERYGRSRFSYPEDDRFISPPGYSGRPTPSGR
jgi:hypothetical protein